VREGEEEREGKEEGRGGEMRGGESKTVVLNLWVVTPGGGGGHMADICMSYIYIMTHNSSKEMMLWVGVTTT